MVLQQTDGREAKTPPPPFIEGTKVQYAWDATSLDALKKCPRYYQYTMIENWQGRTDNIHLRWGLEFHEALEDYEWGKSEGFSHNDSLRESVRNLLLRIDEWNPDPAEGKRSEELKTKEALVRATVDYLDYYEHDAAKTVILENKKPAVELSFSIGMDFGPDESYILCGHLDKIVEFQGDRYVMDHKTTTNTPGKYYFDQYNPNNQMSVYTIAGEVLMQSPIKGVIVDAIQIAVGFIRPVRGITYRTNDQLEEWLGDTRTWLQSAQAYAQNNYWPMNDTSCDKYGGCRFREICSKSPQVRERFLQANFTQENERWNPLKTR